MLFQGVCINYTLNDTAYRQESIILDGNFLAVLSAVCMIFVKLSLEIQSHAVLFFKCLKRIINSTRNSRKLKTASAVKRNSEKCSFMFAFQLIKNSHTRISCRKPHREFAFPASRLSIPKSPIFQKPRVSEKHVFPFGSAVFMN